MYPHRIRLRGPWQCEPLAPPAPASTVTMPCRWGEIGLADGAGRVRCRRRFGRPSRLDEYERVWLTFGGVTASAEAWLNGRPLGRFAEADCPFEAEVTALLGPRNELTVLVEAVGPGGGLWGEVALEVRRTAFLRGLRAWLADGGGLRLTVEGYTVGCSERPLELYALLGGRTVLYAHIEPLPEGRPFRLLSDPLEQLGSVPPVVRVELIDGAVVWYATDVSLEGPAG